MLTAAKIKTLVDISPEVLATMFKTLKKKKVKFKTVNFLGITNGGDFCYHVTFFDDEQAEKVFVKYDHVNDSITVDY
jgi:hypothetical protein